MTDRLNYYFRQKVTEGELDLGFEQLETADQDLMLDMGQTGVLAGMAVTQRGAGANLTVDVAAGVAYDKLGQRIQFSSTQNVDVSVDESAVSTAVTAPGNSKIISVFAKFKRLLTDPRTDGNSVTVYFQEAEGFEFVVRQSAESGSPTPVALDATHILIADITRAYGATTIVTADVDTSSTNRREEALKVAGTPHRLQRGTVKSAFSDMLGWLNAHLDGSADKHNGTAIVVAIAADWANGDPVVATDVDAAFEEIVSSLALTSGAEQIGAVAVSGTLFSYVAENVGEQLQELAAWAALGPRGKANTLVTTSPHAVAYSQRRFVVDTSGGPIDLNLPPPVDGITYEIKDKTGSFGTNACTLVRNGAESIEGLAADRVLSAAWGSYLVWSDGTDWFLG